MREQRDNGQPMRELNQEKRREAADRYRQRTRMDAMLTSDGDQTAEDGYK